MIYLTFNLIYYKNAITKNIYSKFLCSSKCSVFPFLWIPPAILGQVFWAAHTENLTWSRWPTGSSASAALHGILGPCSSCVPIREPWPMWPVLAFHLGSPAPHLVHTAWWSTTNCHWLALRGRVCPPIPLIDSWSSHSAQVSPHRISFGFNTRYGVEYHLIVSSLPLVWRG